MLNDIRAAFAFLTILPVGYPAEGKAGRAFGWFPLVGLFIGVCLALLANLTYPTPEFRGFVLLLVWVILTGGLHLDGFGDSCDGLLATATPERRREIMKDPRTGTWAVLGLILLLLGKWLCLQTTPTPLLLLAPVLGRWVMVIAAYALPYAGSQGSLGAYFRDGLGKTQVISASLILGGVLFFLSPLTLFWVVGVLGIITGCAYWAAYRLGGGLTGDVYGALCELTEVLCLLGVVWFGA